MHNLHQFIFNFYTIILTHVSTQRYQAYIEYEYHLAGRLVFHDAPWLLFYLHSDYVLKFNLVGIITAATVTVVSGYVEQMSGFVEDEAGGFWHAASRAEEGEG